MYRIERSIDISFSHHIRGHLGPCINIHGHTWKFEVALEAASLDETGFVVDFSELSGTILRPCHALLDHALAMGHETYQETELHLADLGTSLLATRARDTGDSPTASPNAHTLQGAVNRFPGGLKVAVFPFSPTSERLAKWLYALAHERLADERVQVSFARVYETLHPVESTATYKPPTKGR